MNSKKLLLSAVASAILATAFLSASQARAQKSVITPSTENVSAQPDLFELSLGYNYIHLGDAFPESEHLHGVDFSAFVNAMSWLALGGDFMANFGQQTIQSRFFFGNIDVDSRRYVYVFGPRVTVWQNPKFRVFAEALAGGVHAEADVTFQAGSFHFSRTVSEDAFAMAVGTGFDWRLTRHFSWRVVQGDYLPTHLGSEWQNNFRLSSGIVYSFGGR